MVKHTVTPRGPSPACKRAEEYFAQHPNTKRNELARMFELDPATISRQPWWKNRPQVVSNNNPKGE